MRFFRLVVYIAAFCCGLVMSTAIAHAAEDLSDYIVSGNSPIVWLNPKAGSWTNYVKGANGIPKTSLTTPSPLIVQDADAGIPLGTFPAGAGVNLSNESLGDRNTTGRTILIAYKTGGDLSGRQILYEEGGVNAAKPDQIGAGINLFINEGQLSGCIWQQKPDKAVMITDPSPVQPNTAYVVALMYNSATKTFYLYRYDPDNFNLYSDGRLLTLGSGTTGNSDVVAPLAGHGDGNAFGNVNSVTSNCAIPPYTVLIKGDHAFKGGIAEALIYTVGLAAADIDNLGKKILKANNWLLNWVGNTGSNNLSSELNWDTQLKPAPISTLVMNSTAENINWDASLSAVGALVIGAGFKGELKLNGDKTSHYLMLNGGVLNLGSNTLNLAAGSDAVLKGGTLSIQTASTTENENGQLKLVHGKVSTGGSLALTYTGEPAAGTYSVITANSITNTFATVAPQPFPPAWGLRWNQSKLYSKGQMIVDDLNQVAQVVLTHDNNIIYCLDENSFVVSLLDLRGKLASTYNGIVTLDTQTNQGTWLVNGVAIGGSDGKGSYQFSGKEGGFIRLTLRYPVPSGGSSSSFTPKVSAQVINDDGTSSVLTDIADAVKFSPVGIILSTNIWWKNGVAVSVPIFKDQIGQQSFTVYLVAYGQGNDGETCGVIANYNGEMRLGLNQLKTNPYSPDIVMDDTKASAPYDTDYYRSNSNWILTPRNGIAAITLNYPDIGELTLEATADAYNDRALLSSTIRYTSKPKSLKVSVTDVSGGTPEASADLTKVGVLAAAGDPFVVKVVAILDNDHRALNFGKERVYPNSQDYLKVVDQLALSVSKLAGGGDVLGTVEPVNLADKFGCVDGICTKSYRYSEVGNVTLKAAFADYLGAGALSDIETVGRFVPAYFKITQDSNDVGSLKNALDPNAWSCDFAYLGQSFGISGVPKIKVVAVNRTGFVTKNYAGSYWKLTSEFAPSIYDQSVISSSSTRLLVKPQSPNLVLSDTNNIGTSFYTLSLPQGFYLSYPRTLDLKVSPFNVSLQFKIDADSLTDLDGVCYKVSGTAAEQCKVFALTPMGGAHMRYGKIVLSNAAGSERAPLKIPITVQYWNGGGFITNTLDDCSGSNLVASFWTYGSGPESANIKAALVKDPIIRSDNGAVLGHVTEGGGYFLLESASHLGPGVSGTLKVGLPISIVPDYLEYSSPNGSTSVSPSALATFGTYQGRDPILFMRPIYGH